MKSDELYELIWNNKGGDSFAFLENILCEKLNDDGVHSLSSALLKSAKLAELLSSYGPGLVSGLCVINKFTRDDWQHLRKHPNEKYEGHHAMVLVGYRIVEGNMRYLLQNWWKTKPNVGVDIDYLLKSKARNHFFKERQGKIGDYTTSFESLVKCESGIDASENFITDGFSSINYS